MACEGCNLSMSLVTYACDDLAYLCISDLIREGTCPVSRPHFPKVVGLWGTLPTKIYAQLRSCTHPQLYDTYTSKYDLWMGTHGHILYMHTDWLIISPVCQEVCQFWAWFEVLLVELHYVFPRTPSMPTSFSLHRWCLLAYIKSPSPSTCLCFPFPSPPSLYSHRNVWYVDQQTGCVIFLLSSREKAKHGRGGEKQPRCHLHSCILHHLCLPDPTIHHTPNLLVKPFTSIPSNSYASAAFGISARECKTGSLITLVLAASFCFFTINSPTRAHINLRECWSAAFQPWNQFWIEK